MHRMQKKALLPQSIDQTWNIIICLYHNIKHSTKNGKQCVKRKTYAKAWKFMKEKPCTTNTVFFSLIVQLLLSLLFVCGVRYGPYAQVNTLKKSSNVHNVFMEFWNINEKPNQPHSISFGHRMDTHIFDFSTLTSLCKSFFCSFFFFFFAHHWLISFNHFFCIYYYGKENAEKIHSNV